MSGPKDEYGVGNYIIRGIVDRLTTRLPCPPTNFAVPSSSFQDSASANSDLRRSSNGSNVQEYNISNKYRNLTWRDAIPDVDTHASRTSFLRAGDGKTWCWADERPARQ